VVAFAQYLREWNENCGYMQECEGTNWQTFLLMPWHLMVSLKPSTFQDVLGLGVLGCVLCVWRGGHGMPRLMALAALAVFLLNLALGQLTPRFFLEPYLWCAAAAVAVPAQCLKAWFVRALTAQGVVVAAVAVYLGGQLFGGALTSAWRERVMTAMTAGYAEAKWLDAVLPEDAVVLENFRYRVLMPRPFVVGDRYLTSSGRGGWWWPVMPIGDRYLWGKGPTLEQALTAFIEEQGVTVLVTQYPITESFYKALVSRYGAPLAGPAQFQAAARSVFNRRKVTGLIVFGINEASRSASQRHISADLSAPK
jgi:hypothetical protein